MFKKVLFISLVSAGLLIFGTIDKSPADVSSQLEQAKTNVRCLIYSGNDAEARTAIGKLTADFSGHSDLPAALYEIAARYEKSRKYEEAKSMYEEIIEQYPDSPAADKAHLGIPRANVLSLIYSRNDTEVQAEISKLTASFSEHPALPAALYDIAARYEKSRKYERAKTMYEQIIQQYSDSPEAGKAQLGLPQANILSLIESREDKVAQVAIDKLIADFNGHSGLPAALYEVAGRYRKSEKYEEAKNIYQTIVTDYPDSEYALKVRGKLVILYISTEKDAEARTAIDGLIADFNGEPALPDALHSIAKAYERSGKYEEAKSMYQYISYRSYPDNCSVSRSRLDILKVEILLFIDNGKDVAVQQGLDRLIADFDGHRDMPEALCDIAKVYEKSGKYEEAKSVHEQIIEQYPDSKAAGKAQLDIPKLQILLFIDDGNDTAAQAAIDSLIADFKDHPDLPRAISRIEEEYYNKILAAETWVRENYRHPVIIWEKVLSKFPDFFYDDPDLYYFIARCYFNLGEYQNAIEYYQTLVNDWPNDIRSPGALYSIICLYEKLERSGRIPTTDAAVQIPQTCERFLVDYPDCRDANEVRKILERWNFTYAWLLSQQK